MKNIEIGGRFTASGVSLGCMRMGGLDEKKVDAIIDTAMECGINFFDHADIYGGGNAEKVFGEYLKRHKDAREKMEPARTGITRRHCAEDYEVVNELGFFPPSHGSVNESP